jgi:hypothetical protein
MGLEKGLGGPEMGDILRVKPERVKDRGRLLQLTREQW